MRLRSFLLSLTAGSTCCASAAARAASWIPIGPEGGGALALAIDPQTPTRVFAATSGGVFRSDDGGDTWSLHSDGLPPRPVQALLLDPSAPDNVYAGTTQGTYRSRDGGVTWTPSDPTAGPVAALAMDPHDSRRIYAATPDGVRWTADGGGRWDKVGSRLPDVTRLVVDPTNSSTLYALNGALFSSPDDGGTWQSVPTPASVVDLSVLAADPGPPFVLWLGGSRLLRGPPPWVEVDAVPGVPIAASAIVSHAGQPPRLYVGSSAGVYVSADGGGTWTSWGSPTVRADIPPKLVHALAIDPTDADVVFAGTTDGIFRTRNGGHSWQLLSAGLLAMRVGPIAVDGGTPPHVYASTLIGMAVTEDGGANWNVAPRTDPTLTGVVAIAADSTGGRNALAGTMSHGLFGTDDGGLSWTPTGGGLPPPGQFTNKYAVDTVAIDPQHPERVFVGTPVGVYRSVDGGNFFFPGEDPATHATTRILIDPYGTVYASTRIGVIRSDDSGESWAYAGPASADPPSLLALDSLTASVVYATVFRNGLFFVERSDDGGATWQPLGEGLSAPPLAIVVDPHDSSSLFLATPGAVLHSADRGTTWSPAGDPLPFPVLDGFAVDPRARQLFVSTPGRGVFRQDLDPCTDALDCDDADPCSDDLCAPDSAMASFVGCVHEPLVGCTTTTAESTTTTTVSTPTTTTGALNPTTTTVAMSAASSTTTTSTVTSATVTTTSLPSARRLACATVGIESVRCALEHGWPPPECATVTLPGTLMLSVRRATSIADGSPSRRNAAAAGRRIAALLRRAALAGRHAWREHRLPENCYGAVRDWLAIARSSARSLATAHGRRLDVPAPSRPTGTAAISVRGGD